MRKSILLILTMLLSLFTTTEVSAEAYAVWCEGNSTMYFLATDANLVAGGTYQGNTITEVWKGTQVTNNSSNVWPMGRRTVVFDSSFRDVRPQSTEKWFSGCGGLTSIQGLQYLNTSLVSSMEAMFAGCESLESLDLSSFDTKNVKSFYYMFSGCTSLKSLKLNFDISSASSMANMFRECKSLKTLDLSCFKSNSMLDLSGMFCMCENLTSVDLSNLETASVKNMGSMFTNCYNLQSLDLSSFDTGKVTNMHEMFAGGYRLSTIYISSKWSTEAVTDSQQMFAACESLPNYNYSEDDKTHAHGGSGGYMTYKPGMEPKGLQDGELFTAKTIEGVEMTFKVISVSENTCMVGGDDWKNMAVDKSTSGTVTIPDKVNDFTVTTIGISAFSNCDKLVKVIMPQSLTTIKSDAFLDCDKLETADIPASVTEIGYQAFVNCYSLKSITIPDGITHIDYNTFAGTAVSSITIPNSVVRLENGAFGCLRNLTSVEIPASVVEISNPFVGCNALTTISVESGNPVYHSDGNCIIETATNRLVVGCKSSVIPSYVTILGNLSFANYNFVEFVVPEGITKVESSAFNNCNVMNKLTLPSTLTALEDYAIYSCSSLTTIVANMKKPFPIGDLKQGNYSNNLLETLYVPAGCKDLYKSTAGWKEIPNIIEMGGAGQQDEFESKKKDLVTRGMAIEAKLADIKTTLEGLSGSGATDLAEKCEQIEVAYLYVLESIQKATTTDELKQCQDDMTAVEAAIAELMAAIDRYQPDVPDAGVSPTQLIVALNGEDGVINVPGAKSISINATLQNGVPVYESYVSVRIEGDKIYVHPVAKGNTGFRVYYNDDSGTNSEWVTVAVVDNLDDVFVAKTTEGVSVMYQILDVSRKTCMVGLGFPAIDVETKGTVTIPETVNGYTVTQIQNEAFEDCSGVTQFNLPSTIEYILFRAFSGCTGITSITLPEGLKDIGNNAFVGCTGLTSINIPKNVSSLQYYIFNNCPNITAYTVDKDNKWYYSPEGSNAIIETRDKALRYGGSTTVIPEEVESIGPRPFDGNNYNDVRLPKNVRALWWDAFLGNPVKTIIVDEANKYFDSRNNCNAIMETATDKLVMGCPNTVIPDDTKILGQNAFRGVLSTGFKSFELPEGLVTIEQQALAECPDLESLTLPSTLKQIGTNALLSNRKLMTITIHAAEPPVVGEYVFDRTDIITLYVPAGSKAKYQAADGWKDFTNIVEVNSGQTDFDKEKAHLKTELAKLMAMIHELDKVLYQKDPDRESELWKELDYVAMNIKETDSKISSISSEADAKNLEDEIMKIRTLIDYLTMEIDKYQPVTSSVFTAKTAEGIEMTFKVISEDEKTVQVGKGANQETAIDEKVTGTVTIPSTVEGYKVVAIGKYAFYRLSKITEVVIPEGVVTIGDDAFDQCTGLKKINFPEGLTSIGESSFHTCSSLQSLVIPASLTSIGYVALAGWSALTSIKVAEGNPVFDSRNDCNAIVRTSTNELIRGCVNTVIPEGISNIGVCAFNGCPFTTITLPSTVKRIDGWAFSGCKNLSSVTIPDGVTYIGYMAFNGCKSLQSVNLPSSLTAIGSYAFTYCDALETIYSYITKPFVLSSESPFSNFETTKLYVPYGTKALYLATEGWNKFQIIVEAEPAKKQKVDFSDFTESTPLNGTVIDNVFYSIKKDNGGYDTSKKCVVVNSAMSDTEMEAIAGETLDNISNKYTGMVLQVPAGKGRLSVNAQATGGLVLKVKIGTNAPKAYSLKGKMKIRVEYDVQVPTYIYIYAGETPASARARRSGEAPSLMIYGISTGLVLGDANGDDSVDVSDVVSTVNKILAKPSNNFDEDAADVNGDGSIDVADVVATVNIILGRTNAAREKNDATGENDRLSLTDSGNNAFSLSLDNEGRYVAAQFDVRLSEGQTLESVLPSLSRCGDHQVAVAEVGSGRYRVVVYDLGLSAFSGHNGELLTLQLADANSGLTIDNITFVRGDQTVRHFAPLFAGPTAITSVVSPNAPADIYSIDGHLLRRQATSTEGLKRGLYIVNGRKMYLGR